jgi:hypothetical protein
MKRETGWTSVTKMICAMVDGPLSMQMAIRSLLYMKMINLYDRSLAERYC